MQSVVMTTEEQVVVEVTEILEILFSTVSYLRNFFPSSYFVTKNIDTVEAKILTPCCPNSSLFISWYKVSVKDAFEKRYLRKLVLAIYLDEKSPEKVSETYTLEFNYDKDTSNSIFQVIRTLSLLTQTLEPLPARKFLTLKLFYNENTPFEYEPEGFKASTNHQFLFESDPLKLDLSSFKIEQGSMSAFINSLFDKNMKNENPRVDAFKSSEHSSQQVNNTPMLYSMQSEYLSQRSDVYPVAGVSRGNVLNVSNSPRNLGNPLHSAGSTKEPLDSQSRPKGDAYVNPEDKELYSQRSIKEIVPSCKLLKKNVSGSPETPGDSIPKASLGQKKSISTLNTQLRPKAKEDEVKCICNINISDSDMLYCDICKCWLHTVCCGFFTNTDRRIPSGKYVCLICTEKSPKSLYMYRSLAIFRRTLSIIYNENLESVSWLSQRLGISHNYSKNTVNRLVNEGFVKRRKIKNGMAYDIIKTQEAKEKIKDYFTLGLKKFKASVPVKDVRCE